MAQVTMTVAMTTTTTTAMLEPMDEDGVAEGDTLGTEGYPISTSGGDGGGGRRGPGSISGEAQQFKLDPNLLLIR